VRGDKPFVFTNLRTSKGAQDVIALLAGIGGFTVPD
jgi:hypothetical protein